MPNRQCCICTAPLRGIGCRADPFPGGMCCDDCKDRIVEPVRVVCGEAVTSGLLKVIRAIAKEGRHVREQRAISQAMAEVASLQHEHAVAHAAERAQEEIEDS